MRSLHSYIQNPFDVEPQSQPASQPPPRWAERRRTGAFQSRTDQPASQPIAQKADQSSARRSHFGQFTPTSNNGARTASSSFPAVYLPRYTLHGRNPSSNKVPCSPLLRIPPVAWSTGSGDIVASAAFFPAFYGFSSLLSSLLTAWLVPASRFSFFRHAYCAGAINSTSTKGRLVVAGTVTMTPVCLLTCCLPFDGPWS
ncbi:uncharacterized protein IWZ02DRAFT_451720 [Phyllosticta citriasiana]|uniref:Uncharacterized protein n=1 Tax=Phyllosticta citriasiana TaxID=595635 RepID=A0ABR1KSQ4_9PEZI